MVRGFNDCWLEAARRSQQRPKLGDQILNKGFVFLVTLAGLLLELDFVVEVVDLLLEVGDLLVQLGFVLS